MKKKVMGCLLAAAFAFNTAAPCTAVYAAGIVSISDHVNIVFNDAVYYIDDNAQVVRTEGEAEPVVVYDGNTALGLFRDGDGLYVTTVDKNWHEKTVRIDGGEETELRLFAESNEQIIYNYLKNTLGLNTAAACGVLANIYKESSFRPTASVLDTNNKTSYGICQWNGGRFTSLQNYCASNGYDYTSLTGQLNYLRYELNNGYKTQYNYMKNNIPDTKQGAYDAGLYWAAKFEVCATQYREGRAELAENTYWPKYSGEVVLAVPSITLKKGSTDSGEIMKLQNFLNFFENAGLEVDGGFGALTETAVKNFQSKYGLEADGSAGPQTRAKMQQILDDYNNRDTQPPVISDIRVTDINKDGYTVNCTINDDKAIGKIQFPTWTQNNGQDDLVWHTYTENSGAGSAIVSYRINCSEHNNEGGVYATHIYVWDQSGNQASYQGDACIVNIDREAPVISSISVTDITDDGYTVKCTITDNNSISSIQFPTWTKNEGQDDIIWHVFTENADSSSVEASYRVKISEHNNEYGEYMTHIYAADKHGNTASAAIPSWVEVQPQEAPETTYVIGDVNGDGELTRTDLTRLSKYFAGWTVEINETAADVNGDGEVTRTDLTRLSKYFAGWDVKLG